MTQEEFIEVLDGEGYSYEIEGDKIIVTRKTGVWLTLITSLPPVMEFNNGGSVYLDSLTSLPPDVVFKNRGDVYLKSLVGEWFEDWKGNIKGIDSKSLLNVMIKRGMFI